MTQISPNPIVLKDVLVQIGADNFEKQVSSVTLTPSASPVVFKGMSPGASYSDMPMADWVAGINYAQDHETVGSLSDYLFLNEGSQVTMIFKPKSGSGPSYQAVVTLTPGAIGGAGNAVAEGSVTLPVTGKPIKIAAGSGIPILATSSPTTGPIAGGTLVQITGSGLLGATAVVFGTLAAVSFTKISDSLLVAVAPAQAAGSKPVKVTNASGQSTTTAPFTYA